jgi:hypothetical protein
LIRNKFLAGFASLLVFTSPMVVYYGPNFLPDVPALSFVFMAWYFLTRFLSRRSVINLWISAFLFCLAMLLKITSAISFIALGGWVLYELAFMKKEKRIFNFKWDHFLPFLLGIIPVLSWYLYAGYYNRIHSGHFSYHGIWPVWNMTREQFSRIIDVLDKIYFKELFLPYTQCLTFILWLFLLMRFKSLAPICRYFIIVLPVGVVFQLILWFQVLEGHDYYMINLLVALVAVWGIFLAQLNRLKPILKSVAYVIAGAFFIWNVITCQDRIKKRYEGWMNGMYFQMKALTEIEPSFQKWRIKPEDKVISIPDNTINGSLYYMNRKGYTEFGSDFSREEIFYQRINQGAKYLIVNDSSVISNEHLKPFIQKRIGVFENILVFDIQGIEPETKQ